MPKILFIGDVVGKPGRRILREVLPQWKEKYKPDVTIVNVENLAHGKGVTLQTMAQLQDLGIDAYTSGNHVFDKLELSKEVFEKYPNIVRPVNYVGDWPGHGYYRFSKEVSQRGLPSGQEAAGAEGNPRAKSQQFLVLDTNANVFMEKQFPGNIDNAFLAIDRLLLDQAQKGDIIFVDFHSEVTSEKISMGYHLEGRVSAIVGTHTHVPTADARVLPGGTAYISDVGMTGARDGVLGVKKQNALAKFLDPSVKFKNEVEEEGVLQINGVLIEIDDNQKAVKIEKLYHEIS